MSNKFENPIQFSPEEIGKIEEQRTIEDAEKLKEGAKYNIDAQGNKRLEPSDQQMEEAKQEMQEERLSKPLKSNLEAADIRSREKYGIPVMGKERIVTKEKEKEEVSSQKERTLDDAELFKKRAEYKKDEKGDLTNKDDQSNILKERIIADAELLKNGVIRKGAEYRTDNQGRLIIRATERQLIKARKEMEKELLARIEEAEVEIEKKKGKKRTKGDEKKIIKLHNKIEEYQKQLEQEQEKWKRNHNAAA